MHTSRILVDLPSAETDRKKGPIEWLRSLFGAQLDLRSGKEELTVEALWLVEGLVEAFAAAGVHDVVSFLVDREVVYVDNRDVPDDLPLILRAAKAAGVLDRTFREMHLVLAHRSERLHTIIDCAVKNGVLLGEAEMTITLSSRLLELQVRGGETARAYADRVQAFAGSSAGTGSGFEPTRRELDALTQRISNELTSILLGSRVTPEPARVRIVRPGVRQIGRFRALGFGDRVEAPRFRSVPTTQRRGAYHDPFYYHYHDPYHDLTSYLVVDAMLRHTAASSLHVHVVDPQGNPLPDLGASREASGGSAAWAGAGAVTFGEGGELEVSRAIPTDTTGPASLEIPGAEAPEAADADGAHRGAATFDASSAETSSELQSGSGSSCGSASCGSSSSCGSSCSSSSSCGSSSSD